MLALITSKLYFQSRIFLKLLNKKIIINRLKVVGAKLTLSLDIFQIQQIEYVIKTHFLTTN